MNALTELAAESLDAMRTVQRVERGVRAARAGHRAYVGAGLPWKDRLSDAWNALRNDVHGLGPAPQAMPDERGRVLQAQILQLYKRFRDFRASWLTLESWDEWAEKYTSARQAWLVYRGTTTAPMTPTEGSLLEEASNEYGTALSQSSLPEALSEVLPDASTFTPGLKVAAAAAGGAAVVGLLWFFSRSTR